MNRQQCTIRITLDTMIDALIIGFVAVLVWHLVRIETRLYKLEDQLNKHLDKPHK